MTTRWPRNVDGYRVAVLIGEREIGCRITDLESHWSCRHGGRSVTALWLISEHQDLPSDVELSLAERLDAGMAKARAVEFRRSRLWMRRCLADGFGVDPAVVPLLAHRADTDPG